MNEIIGFVVAMKKEANLILREAQITEEKIIAGKQIYIGKIWDVDFALVLAGIGKVNAAMSTQILIDQFKISRIINFGVAGGKQGCKLKAGDVVQVGQTCQYDFDLSELDDVSIGYMQDYDLIYYPISVNNSLSHEYPIVNCATGDRFTSKTLYLDIIHDLNAQVVDMECGAIAQVCYANQKPINIIKLISDVDGENESIYEQYANNVSIVVEKIPNALKKFLKN